MSASIKVNSPRRYSRLYSIAGFRGERTVPNSEVIGPIDSSDEWIRQRTGIVSRRYAAEGTTLEDMCVNAAERALENAGIEAAQLGAVIVSTVTHFVQTPALATTVAHRIGATPAAAYDISAACAGYCYATAQADALVSSGQTDYVLIIGAEKMSDFIDPTDRSISFLLGDGAGAAVVGPSETPGISQTIWGADGGKADLITQTDPWSAYRQEPQTPWPTLRQQGPSVFKWAAFKVPATAKKAIEAAGLKPEDIDVFVPHQANIRIIDQMVKQLKLREDVAVGRDIVETGNTSAASIPLATERLLREGTAKTGDLQLQIGFGAGLAYAAQVVVLP